MTAKQPTIPLNQIKPNPNNPRSITETDFIKLKESIRTFPQMMQLRPMVTDEHGVLLGGNMRLRALHALGFTEIPASWVVKAADLTDAQKREFVVKDNTGFGQWDWDAIANEWDDLPLSDWGLDVPSFEAAQADEAMAKEPDAVADTVICPACQHEFKK